MTEVMRIGSVTVVRERWQDVPAAVSAPWCVMVAGVVAARCESVNAAGDVARMLASMLAAEVSA